MCSTYTLNISNEVKYHFYDLIKCTDYSDENFIVDTVKNTLQRHQSIDHVHYLNQRIETIADMLAIITDKRWPLSKEHKDYIFSGLKYFTENNDIIPDDTPVIGYLDDCIVIDLVTEKVQTELKQYQEFYKMINTYDLCDVDNPINLWQNLKRQELSSRIRHRRRKKTHNKKYNSRIRFI